jgi:WS/DGAT/MGAT family acyltransferase
VRPLDGPDLFHLAQERADRPMHTLKVAILDRALDPADVRRWAVAVLPTVEPLRLRLAGLPLARPVWVDAGPLDLDYHLVHHLLDAPGSESELTAELSRLCGARLDRDRPLWRVWHLTGLAGRGDAFVLQVHHAVADGAGSVALWTSLADGGAGVGSRAAPGIVRWSALASGTVRRGTAELLRLPSQVRRFAGYVRAAGARAHAGDVPVTKAFQGPPTRFNVEPYPDRRCAFVTLPLPLVRAARAAHGATLTEVFLAVTGRAVHRHLELLGEAPDAALTATVPAALPVRSHPFGNHVTSLYVSLHSDLADPGERLAAVRASLGATREATDRDPRLLPDWQRYPRLNHAIIRVMEFAERRQGRPAYNLIVSSVRGPDRLSIAGAEVVELRSVGPLAGNFGLNITGWTYGDDLTVGIHAYAPAASKLDRIGELVLDELVRCGRHDSTSAGGPRP